MLIVCAKCKLATRHYHVHLDTSRGIVKLMMVSLKGELRHEVKLGAHHYMLLLHVPLQMVFTLEGEAALFASPRPHVLMHRLLVLSQLALLAKRPLAFITLKSTGFCRQISVLFGLCRHKRWLLRLIRGLC